MKVRHWVLLIGLALLLTSCGQWYLGQRVDITPGFTPTTLGFEVQDDGTILIASHVMNITSRRGSLGGIIRGYQVEYLDPTGNPIREGDSILYSRGSLNVVVPPGLTCAEENIALCTVASPGVRFIERESEPVSNTVTLPGPIAIEVLQGGFVGARANFYFSGTSDRGDDFFLGPFEVAISFPVTN